jgi:tRNA(Glu) U13 pseudouridine synthase TruD
MRPAAGVVGELERRVLESRAIDPTRRVRGLRTPGTRRSLRARILEPRLTFEEPGTAVLEVTLEPGVYATVLLEELFPGEAVVEGPAD